MTDKLREAAQMALDALESKWKMDRTALDRRAIVALRAALAQPEQEPVASMVITMGEVTSMQPYKIAAEMLDGTHQLYTAPPQRDDAPAKAVEWQGLTDEDLSVCDEDGVILARYWEAKLKEKNT